MTNAHSDRVLGRTRSDLKAAFERARAVDKARREAAAKATLRAARWSSFAPDPGFGDALVGRAVALAQVAGTVEIAGDAPDAAEATMSRLLETTDGDAARIFGYVASPEGGGEADLVDGEGCVIARSPIDALGHYAIVAEATGETARIRITDASGQLALVDGRPIELTTGLVERRDYTTQRCGKVAPAPAPDGGADRAVMPGLVGESVADARAALAALGDFRISMEEAHSDDAPEGQVISQAPGEGSEIEPGALIRLGVSLGPEPRQEMPGLLGLTEAEALKTLADFRYRAVEFSQVVDPENAGKVVEQTPEEGAPLGENATIALCMAVTARLMPDLVGRTRKEALEVLVPDYVDAPRIEEAPSAGEAGVVIRHEPKAGAAIGDDGVTLVISAKRVAEDDEDHDEEPHDLSHVMPDLIGKTRDEAQGILVPDYVDEFDVVEQTDDHSTDTVIGQKPNPGSEIADGVILVVSTGKEAGSKEDHDRPAKMPDVRGMTRAKALKALKAAGIDDPVFDEPPSRRRGARVTGQSPEAGTTLAPGQDAELEFGKPD